MSLYVFTDFGYQSTFFVVGKVVIRTSDQTMSDVVENGVIEEDRVLIDTSIAGQDGDARTYLLHDSDITPERLHIVLLNVYSIHSDAAGRYVIKSLQQGHNRAFSTATGSDDGSDLSSAKRKVEFI